MKKTFLLISTILCLLLVNESSGAPFLVCDEAGDVTGYEVNLDGDGWEVTPAPLKYDLEGIVEGGHTVEVRAVNLWGESPSVPFDFTKTLPSLTNIQLSKD